MTYEELTKEIAQLALIPQQELPSFDIVLKDETKQKLAERSPQDVAMILWSAVKQISQGSVERVDALVNRAMES